MAEALLSRWEERVGPLKSVRADLWGKGGRLEGCRKVRVGDGMEGTGLTGQEVSYPGRSRGRVVG